MLKEDRRFGNKIPLPSTVAIKHQVEQAQEKEQVPCKLCGTPFKPEQGQQPAHWAATWCSEGKGLLCPPCQHAAGEVEGGSALDPKMPLGCMPFGSDILKASKSCTKEVWEKRRGSESWRTWVETNRPEWLSDEDKRN